jgi:hypothetical protein
MSTLSTYSVDPSNIALDASFAPVKTLTIHSRGIRLIRLPVPSSELTIPVYDTTGRVCYVSRRNKIRSGNAILFGLGDSCQNIRGLRQLEQWYDDGESWEGFPLIETKYFFGPGRDPIIELLDQDEPPAYQVDAVDSQPSLDEKREPTPSVRSSATAPTLVASPSSSDTKTSFKFTSAWSLHVCTFTVPGTNNKFSWEKGRATLPSGEKAKLLCLYFHLPSSNGDAKAASKVKVAQLVRSATTRTPGTRPSTAGNGGRLEFSRLVRCTGDLVISPSGPSYDTEKAVGAYQNTVIDEALVVATCISMLKKEGDRRRALQFMMIAAMASGGA